MIKILSCSCLYKASTRSLSASGRETSGFMTLIRKQHFWRALLRYEPVSCRAVNLIENRVANSSRTPTTYLLLNQVDQF